MKAWGKASSCNECKPTHEDEASRKLKHCKQKQKEKQKSWLCLLLSPPPPQHRVGGLAQKTLSITQKSYTHGPSPGSKAWGLHCALVSMKSVMNPSTSAVVCVRRPIASYGPRDMHAVDLDWSDRLRPSISRRTTDCGPQNFTTYAARVYCTGPIT